MNIALSFDSPAAVHVAIGPGVLVSGWMEVTQDRIQKFAEATGDYQWIHVDAALAQRATRSPEAWPVLIPTT